MANDTLYEAGHSLGRIIKVGKAAWPLLQRAAILLRATVPLRGT